VGCKDQVSLGRFLAPDFTFSPKNLVFTPKAHPNVVGYKMGFYFTLRAKHNHDLPPLQGKNQPLPVGFASG
jgi:hypothetical protein